MERKQLDLAEGYAWPDGAFGAVVGCRQIAVCDEDEEVLAESFDHVHELATFGSFGCETKQFVELVVERSLVGAQSGVGQFLAPSSDGADFAKKIAQARLEDAVAGINGILYVAQQMGEADLMLLLRPAHLGGEAVGDPIVRTMSAREGFDHILAAGRLYEETGAVGMVEHPIPPCLFADPHAGRVGLQDGAGKKPVADRRSGFGKCLFGVVQNVDQSAFADRKPEKIARQLRMALEGDRMADRQVDEEGACVGAQQRSRLQSLRRFRLDAL